MIYFKKEKYVDNSISYELQHLFSQVKIGHMKVKNRLAMAPMGAIYPNVDGFLYPELRDFIITRAKGGVGLIVLADAGLGFTILDAEVSPGKLQKLVNAAREVVAAVHEESVCVGVQLHHSGRQVDFMIPGAEIVGPSPIPWSPRAPIPRELTEEEIENLIERYVRAAFYVQEAGFDFVEVKACHGYLLGSFLSLRSNKRKDKYGGSLQNRARITTEIIKRIKKKVSDNFLVSCRFNGSDHIKGGTGLEESLELSNVFIKAGADILSVSAGVYGSYPVIIPPYDAPPGCYIPLAEDIKKHVNVPVIAVGRINDPKLGNEIIKAGKADIVAMGRALIADPELPNKAIEGRFQDIRKCIACNQGCFDKPDRLGTTCLVNPAAAREKSMQLVPALVSKRVMVVGGGPAGMEAANVAALRGHNVHLYEKDKELGGQWKLASIPPDKESFSDLTNYLLTQLKKNGVHLHLETVVNNEMLKSEAWDVIVLATGAIPIKPDLGEAEEMIMAEDVLIGKTNTGERVLIVGGNAIGLEVAVYLAMRGKKVEVMEMMDHIGRDLGATVRSHLRHRLAELKVKISSSTKVERISKGIVSVIEKDNSESQRNVDSVVIAIGSRSNNLLAESVKSKMKEVYLIGDAVKPRNALFAIREGAEIGRKI